ncbi:MAG: fatty acid desaturase [Thiobacillaceae bacterium]
MTSIPTVKEVRRTLSQYAVPSTPHGLALFLFDIASYVAAIAIVFLAPWGWVKFVAGIFAGAKMANLATLAHDASHNSLTASRSLNKLIAIVSFTPSLFNYRLWVYDHHNLHHHNTNENHPDSFTPISRAEYAALTSWGKLKHRFYRSTSLWAFGIYYISERWWKVKFFPRAHMPSHVRRAAWPYFLYLMLYLGGYLMFLMAAPLYSETDALTAVMCGFVVPFYVFQSLFSFTVYVQHTHPRVAWFKGKPDRNADGRQELISVHLRFPKGVSWLFHHVYEHAAHHVHPAIPCYRLPEAQAKLNEMIGSLAISEPFSFAWLSRIQRRCELYDFENHRWLSFEGEPRSRITLASEVDTMRQAWIPQVLNTH